MLILLSIYIIVYPLAVYLVYSTGGPVWRAFLLATLWPGALLGALAFFCKVMLEDFLNNLPVNKL